MGEEKKYTPWPWLVVEMQPRKHSTTARYLIQSGEANICTLDVAGREPGRDEANANLIAAAPDLLAALKEALAEAEERGEDLGYNCWPQVRAAIAKAEGESK